jgi:hypothetical protein
VFRFRLPFDLRFLDQTIAAFDRKLKELLKYHVAGELVVHRIAELVRFEQPVASSGEIS